jgi:hypothetical protein
MPNPTEPRVIENTPVQLARMEGVLNLVADRVSGLMTRVDRHEADLGGLQSRTQRLEDGAKASTEKAEALALALKEAKDAVDATSLQESQKAATAAREKSDKDALGWSPITKLFAILAGILIAVNIYQALNL